jgi:peptide/nickel transport system permease protein
MPYYLRRFINSMILLILTISFVFLAGRMIGDPALNVLGAGASEVALERLRVAAGFNDPLWQQYLHYMGNLLVGDFGVSYRYGFSVLPTGDLENFAKPVFDIVVQRLPATFFLACVAMGIALPTAIFMGVTAAVRPRSVSDRAVTIVSLAGVSVVQFWLGLMLIVFFSVQLHWLPTGGYDGFEYVILPAIALAARPIGRLAQVTRSAMLDELAKPYIVTARAKGLKEFKVIYLHALKNSAIPIVTMVGDELSALLTGAILVEKIFAWPGIGQLIIDSMTYGDLPIIQASIAIVAAVVIVVNLVVDLSYQLFNPKIQLGELD